jgi:hypothetical protein
MVTLYASERQHALKLRALLPPEQPAAVAEDWTQFERMAPTSSCSVVGIDWLHTSPASSQLSGFKNRHPRHPVILVTRWEPENARHLTAVRAEEVVWSREVERELPAAVRRVCRSTPNPVHCLAFALEEAEHLPATLRKALTHVCRSERPVYSGEALAAAMGCNRRMLSEQWNKASDPSTSLRLQDFLHWLLLLRAIGRKVPERSWESVAHDLNVHPHTLGRWAKQLAGRTLRELSTVGSAVVGTMLHYRVMTSLLRDAGSDKV